MAYEKPLREMPGDPNETPKSLREAKKAYVERVLRETSFDLAEAARLLAVDETEFHALLDELGIKNPKPGIGGHAE